ncbi:MAG: hypothetical protein H6727_02330 [Myxococcales bacterium]|nr:hypothetical protein [Myxococcales bacterium]
MLFLFCAMTWSWGCNCDLRRTGPQPDGQANADGGGTTEKVGIEIVGGEKSAQDGISTPDGAPDEPSKGEVLLPDGSTLSENPPTEPVLPDGTTGSSCQGAGQSDYSDLLLEMKNRKGYIQIPVEQASLCISGATCQDSCVQTNAQGEYKLSQIPYTSTLRWEIKHPEFDTLLFYGTYEAIERHRRITNPFQVPRKDTLKPFLEPVVGEALDPTKGLLFYFLGQDGIDKPDVKLSTTDAKGPYTTINFFSVNGYYANVAPGSYTLEALVDAQTICVPELAEGIAADNTARLRIEAGKITYVTFLCKAKP